MKYKQVVKLIIDIAMYLIFVALMQEHLWDGLHEWLGIALFTLFIVHTILNFRWYQSLFKGKYTPTRTTSAVINIALFAAMLCCMVSSVLVSGKVFAFLNLGIEPSLFRLTLHGGVPFLLLCHDGALHDGLGKHLKVGGRDFQFHVRALFDQTFYGDHKYQF